MELPDPAAYVRKLSDRQLRAYQKFYPENSREWKAAQREFVRRHGPSLRHSVIVFARNAWFEWRRGWAAFLAVGLLVAVAVWFAAHDAARLSAGGTPDTVTIVSFDTTDESGEVMVVARSSDGVFVTRRLPHALVRGCRIGDRLAARRMRNSLTLEPMPCQSIRS